MIRNNIRFVLAAAILSAAASWPAQAWVASGPRGVAAGHGGSGVAYGARGGSAAWSHGAGYAHGAYGGTAAWNHGGYYRPPVRYPVPVYRGGYYGGGYSSGQVAAAGVAGLAVGAMVGAAAASSHSAPPPTTVVVQQPAQAYSSQMPIGTQVTVLPGNCGSATVQGVEYYQCGPNWYKPYFGNSSVYYQVVPVPY